MSITPRIRQPLDTEDIDRQLLAGTPVIETVTIFSTDTTYDIVLLGPAQALDRWFGYPAVLAANRRLVPCYAAKFEGRVDTIVIHDDNVPLLH